MAEFRVSEISLMRNLLEKLYLKMGDCDGRVSLAKLLQLSEEVKDAVYSTCVLSALAYLSFLCFLLLVLEGGRLFELFIDLMGTPTTMKDWNKFKARRSGLGFNVQLSEQETQEIIDREGTRFQGFVLNASGMSTAGRKQKFYLTFVSIFHGLSKMGVNILSSFNVTMPSSSYYRMRKDEIEEAKLKVR